MAHRLFGWIHSRTNTTTTKQGKPKPPKRLLDCEFLEQRAAPTDTISSLLGLGFAIGGSKLLGDQLANHSFARHPQPVVVTDQGPLQLSRSFPAEPPEAAAGDSTPPARAEPIQASPAAFRQDSGPFGRFNEDPFNLFADARPAAPH